jgi:hypothetical protein
MKKLSKRASKKSPKSAARKLPKTYQGAAVVRGRGMNSAKFAAFVERKALDDFDATRDMWLVIEDKALENSDGFIEVRGFINRGNAVRCARALSNGTIDHRVLLVTEQVLVVATANEL